MPGPIIIIEKSAPRPLNVVGEHITVLASGDQTGSYEVFHQEGAEGSGPPPHSHPWDEAFYIVRGEVAGTPAGPLFGAPHTGKSFRIMSIDIQTIKDGKLVKTYHLENWLAALGQLRAA